MANTIGIVAVAFLAARTANVITATRPLTKSAASAGSRSI